MMRRYAMAAVVVATVCFVTAPAWADDGNPDPLTASTNTAANTSADKHSFVATSTAFVDPDGKTHEVDTRGSRAASPYEYQVHRFAGICPNDPLGQPQALVFVDRRLV